MTAYFSGLLHGYGIRNKNPFGFFVSTVACRLLQQGLNLFLLRTHHAEDWDDLTSVHAMPVGVGRYGAPEARFPGEEGSAHTHFP
jgi:hypothetical protein